MSGLHRRPVPSRDMGRRVMGAGVAGVATVFAIAPGALADTGDLTTPDTGSTSTATASPSDTSTPAAAAPSQEASASVDAPSRAAAPSAPNKPTKTTSAPSTQANDQARTKTAKVAKATVAPDFPPNYGSQKIRLGVQIKDGSFVAPGITTTGSQITIVESGPSVGDGGGTMTTTCTTEANTTNVHGSTATFCVPNPQESLALRASGRKPASVHGPVPPEDDTFQTFLTQTYEIRPGDTATISQTGVNDGLIGDPSVDLIGPCVYDNGEGGGVDPDVPVCAASGVYDQYVFEDTGLPPTAVDDTANTCVGVPVDIDVLKNDTSDAPVTALEVASGPDNGTTAMNPVLQNGDVKAHLTGDSPFTVQYTPKSGFTGTDSFGYSFDTANGSAGAKASIVVIGGPSAADDSAKTAASKAVTVDVTANDDANGGSALVLKSVAAPGHGTAKVDGAAVSYTPDADFVGTDTFQYTVATGCGVATATVSVVVAGSGKHSDNSNVPPAPLAKTGAPAEEVLEISLALLSAGAVATTFGRRRARGRHAV